MEIALFVILILLCITGVLLAVLQLPGTWLILAAAIGYDAYHDWARLGWKWLAGLAAFAICAEVVDSLASMIAARRAGASRRAAVGALIGGFLGMLLVSVPLPIIGVVIGGLIGCFLGAVAAELTKRDDVAFGVRVGLFATLGRTVGLAFKTAAAMVIGGATILLAIQGLRG